MSVFVGAEELGRIPPPHYADATVTLYHGDARHIVPLLPRSAVVMSDPPYNIGYRYRSYGDRLATAEYLDLLALALRPPSVVIHYPEVIVSLGIRLGMAPEKVVAWVYNANTPKQWRAIAWFGISPDLARVRQPYKNPTDKRVRSLIASGSRGRALYDWWHIDQVKNVSGEKTTHPCQIPLELMRRVVAVTPADLILDPFAGSGTTLRAAKDFGRRAVGIESDEHYCDVIAHRLSQEVLGLPA